MTSVGQAGGKTTEPGRLTPFEEYMFVDGLSAYPMSCFVFLRFRGRCDETVLRSVMAEAARRHPLLSSTVEQKRRGVYRWRETDPPLVFLRQPDQTPESLLGSVVPDSTSSPCRFIPTFEACGVDLFHAPAIRVNYWTNGNTTDEPEWYFLFELNHSASDATGFFRFLEDALLLYANKVSGSKIPLVEYDQSWLPVRRFYHRTWFERWRMLPRQLWGLERARTFLLRRIRPLVKCVGADVASQVSDSDGKESFPFSPAFLWTSFTVEESERIRNEAKRQNATLNDLFLAAVFRGVRDTLDDPLFSSEDQARLDPLFLRIAVPMNLRNEGCEHLSATNLASMVFLDRKKANITDNERFTTGIHREMNHIKVNELGFAFVHGLRFFKRLLGGFSLLCRGGRCWTTGTVSNLGVLFRGSPLIRRTGQLVAGELELVDVQTSPPIRSQSVFGISIESYAGKIFYGMQYDSKQLSSEQSVILFSAIKNQLQRVSSS